MPSSGQIKGRFTALPQREGVSHTGNEAGLQGEVLKEGASFGHIILDTVDDDGNAVDVAVPHPNLVTEHVAREVLSDIAANLYGHRWSIVDIPAIEPFDVPKRKMGTVAAGLVKVLGIPNSPSRI